MHEQRIPTLPAKYPTSVLATPLVTAALERQLGIARQEAARLREVVRAMRARPWWRVGILLRRPWRVLSLPEAVRQGFANRGVPGAIRAARGWIFREHDCTDPTIGCSCPGSVLHPYEWT